MHQHKKPLLLCLLRYPNSAPVFRGYARFLEHIKSDPWTAAKYSAAADEIEEEEVRVCACWVVLLTTHVCVRSLCVFNAEADVSAHLSFIRHIALHHNNSTQTHTHRGVGTTPRS